MIKFPFIILAYERATMINDMIQSIEKSTDMSLIDLIIVDNHSQSYFMKMNILHYRDKGYTVLNSNKNIGLEGYNLGLQYAYQNKHHDYFLMSDPDIILNPNMPKDWPLTMMEMLHAFPEVAKVGVALDYEIISRTNDSEQNWNKMKLVYQNEKKLQNENEACNEGCNKMYHYNDIPFFYSPVDTTLCCCRNDMLYFWDGKSIPQFKIRDYYFPQTFYNKKFTDGAIRIGGEKYKCRHLGWETENPRYRNDFEEYKKGMKRDGIDERLASTMKMIG